MERCALGILINLRQAIVSAVWLDGTVIFSEEGVLEAAAPADETLERLCGRLLELSSGEGLRKEQILGVGVAIRGVTSIDGQETRFLNMKQYKKAGTKCYPT